VVDEGEILCNDMYLHTKRSLKQNNMHTKTCATNPLEFSLCTLFLHAYKILLGLLRIACVGSGSDEKMAK